MTMNANEKVTYGHGEESDIEQFFQYLLDYRNYILIITLAVVMIAVGYTIDRPLFYEGNILIQVEDNDPDNSIQLPQLHIASNAISPIAFESALIQSRIVLEPIVTKLGLNINIVSNSHFPFVDYFFGKSQKRKFSFDHYSIPQAYLNKTLILKVVDGKHYHLLNKKHHLLIAGTINKLVKIDGFECLITKLPDVANKTYRIIQYSPNKIVEQILAKMRVQQFGETMENQTGILQISYRDTNPKRLALILNEIANTTLQKNIQNKSQEASQTLKFLNEQLPLVKKSLEKAEYKLNHYRATSGKIDIKILTEQLMEQVANVEKQIVEANLYKTNLLQIYTNKHPFVLEIETKIAALKKLQNQLVQKIKGLPEADQVAINLMRDAKVKNDLYLVLLNKIQETRVLSSGISSDVHILETAHAPDSPLPRKTSLVFIASTLLGFMLSCVIILFQKTFIRRVSDPAWTEKIFGIPNLVVVPFSNNQSRMQTDYNQKKNKKLQLLALSTPQDISIEALRSLRTSFEIFLSNPNAKIINFTGVSAGVGKSFVSANFACLLSHAGKKVLLIDADMRRGILHQYFGVNQMPGLNELITNEENIDNVIKDTQIANLSYLPCGRRPPRTAELLMKNQFKSLLDVLKENYDYIIIDTAPVLAVTDSTIIALLSDALFLIIGANVHHPNEVALTIKRLQNAGVKINGTIFNNLNKQSSRSGKYRHYYYSYTANNAESTAQ